MLQQVVTEYEIVIIKCQKIILIILEKSTLGVTFVAKNKVKLFSKIFINIPNFKIVLRVMRECSMRIILWTRTILNNLLQHFKDQDHCGSAYLLIVDKYGKVAEMSPLFNGHTTRNKWKNDKRRTLTHKLYLELL